MSTKHVKQVLDYVRGKPPVVRLLLVALAEYANCDGQAFPAIRCLAGRIERSYERTRTLLRNLEREGLLKRVPRYDDGSRRQTSNGYVLTIGESPDETPGCDYGDGWVAPGCDGERFIQNLHNAPPVEDAAAAADVSKPLPRSAPLKLKQASQGGTDLSLASSWWPAYRRRAFERAMGMVGRPWVQPVDRDRAVGSVAAVVCSAAEVHGSSFLAGLLRQTTPGTAEVVL